MPWQAALSQRRNCSAATSQFVLGASGHIAGVINPASKNKRSYWIDGTLGDDPEQWLEIGEGAAGKLVDALDRVAAAACGQAGRGAEEAGQHEVQADRAGAGALCGETSAGSHGRLSGG